MQQGVLFDEAKTEAEGMDFLNQFVGEGTSGISQAALATSYLAVTQKLTEAVTQGIVEEGVFYNTGSQKSMGTEVRTIPIAFKEVWDERDEAGLTVNRWEPYSIDVITVPPPAGKRGFPKLISPDGNQIIHTFAYAVLLPDDLDAGYVMMTAGVGSMKAFRRWNTMIKNLRLPNGNKAPIFSKIYRLYASSKISSTTKKPYYAVSNVVMEDWVDNSYEQLLIPALKSAQQFLLTAPTAMTDDQDSEE